MNHAEFNGGPLSPEPLKKGEIMPETNQNGYASPEFITAREGYWVTRDGKIVWTLCGDDRPASDASVAELTAREPEVMSPAEGALGAFGQVPGMTKIMLVAGGAQYGEQFIKEFATKFGSFDGGVAEFARRAAADTGPGTIRPALHSDSAKEAAARAETGEKDISALFCPHGTSATGCAYCGGVGLTADMIANDATTFDIGRQDITHAFGNDEGVEALRDGNEWLANWLGKDYVFGRQNYIAAGMPVVILEGSHIAAARTAVLANFNPHEVGNATGAHNDGKDFYRLDIAGVALLVRRLFPEYNLSADLLMRSQVLDAVPVRAVLASHDAEGDHTPDPRRVPFGARGGDAASALREIALLEAA